MSRLFVAVWPPAEVIEHVRRLPRDGWAGLRWTPERNWHVTLRFVGEANPDELTGALAEATLPAVTAVLGTRPRILGRSSLVLPVDGLDELAQVVRSATRTVGRAEDPAAPFRGHLTIGRFRGARPIARNPRAGQLAAPVDFGVDQVAVVESIPSPSGATYTTLVTFRTGGAR